MKSNKHYHEGTWIYTIHPGRWSMYNHESDMPGVTIHYQASGPVSTIVYCDSNARANELIEDLNRRAESIHVEQKRLGEYIRTNKLY